MNKTSILFVFLFLLALSPTSFGQNRTKSIVPKRSNAHLDKLVGTWRVIEYSDFDSLTGKWKDRYGQQPRGFASSVSLPRGQVNGFTNNLTT